MSRILKFSNDSVSRRGFLALSSAIATVAAMPRASLGKSDENLTESRGTGPVHGIAMVGQPALPPGFPHLPYANPDAPKGGRIRLSEPGSFDSLNPWILKGNAAWPVSLHVAESLLYRSLDEPFTLYGLLAETVETDAARGWIEFTLREGIRFSDGDPVTMEDVLWSYETLGTKGHPRYHGAWSRVTSMEQTGKRSLRFTFEGNDRELALLMGMRPILKKAQWEEHDFSESGLVVPIGSGPYVIENFEAGRSITFRRNPDWWGSDLKVNQGLYNVETLHYDYYSDGTVMFEAFKSGNLDVWREQNGARWLREFNFPAIRDGRVTREEIPHQRPSGIVGLVMNTRNPHFADWRVRQALIEAFNFRFINLTLGGGVDPRITSYFSNSDLGVKPGPASEEESALLAPFDDDLLPGTLEGYSLPEGSENAVDRRGIRTALGLMAEAGWTIQDGVLVNEMGQPFSFEILLNQTGTAMRSASETRQVASIYADTLKNLGIAARITLLDSAQYVERTNNYQFDMTWYERGLSLSPGVEQRLYWGSAGVTRPGTWNWMGVASPAVDAMIDRMVTAESRTEFTTAVRALDRLLIAGRYVIPVGFSPVSRLAHIADLEHPDQVPIYGDWPGFLPDTWWLDQPE